jgi:hypothetical protein
MLMDKSFWIEIAQHAYALPEGHDLHELTGVLFNYLGDPDPELRDDIAYGVYANWLKQKRYPPEIIREHIARLLANLESGIGETESDSVFLRTFSVLFLAEIVHNDNKSPLLEKEQVSEILARGLWYLAAEQDPRGHIPVKGWAHALAHTADLLLVLGKNRNTEKEDLERILTGIADKLVGSTNSVYIHGEDERLASAVTALFSRDLVTMEFVAAWLKSFTQPNTPWLGAYTNAGQAKAFHNSRNFLRSLAYTIETADPRQDTLTITHLVHDALDELRPY